MIPEVKTRIRQMNVAEMARIADECVRCGTAQEVADLLGEAGPTEPPPS